MDEHVLDRAVLAPQRRLEVVDDVATHEPAPELVEPLSLDVKFGELMADVFVRGVSQQFKLCRICPKDFSVGTNLMKSFECVLDEIRKLLLTEMKRLFRF